MFSEHKVRVSDQPEVVLFVAETHGPAEPPLLVVHGGPDWDHSYLRDPLGQLAGQRQILLPDLRGCGRSTRGLPESQYTWDLVVADLIALLDTEEITQTDVMGFSTGGLIAQRLALAAPQRVRRLVIASSSVPPLPPDAFAGWAERAVVHAAAAAVRAREAHLVGPDATRADAVSTALANVWQPTRLSDYLRRLGGVRFSSEWARPFERGTLPPVRVPDAERRLTMSGLPILLLHGRQDMIFPVELAELVASRNPAASAVILDQAGHMAHIDQPDAWLAALVEFLA
jgi:pimeloyl-ACP methyl ester carboxylesterase